MSVTTEVPNAYWIDKDGTEHQIESITPHSQWPNWLLVRFVSPDMDASMVQSRHVIVRSCGEPTPDLEVTVIAEDTIERTTTAGVEVKLERWDFENQHEWSVLFTSTGSDYAEIGPDQIPALIDMLAGMHQKWQQVAQ